MTGIKSHFYRNINCIRSFVSYSELQNIALPVIFLELLKFFIVMVRTNVRIIAVKYYFRKFRPVALHITKNVRRITKVLQKYFKHLESLSRKYNTHYKVMKLFANPSYTLNSNFKQKNVRKLTLKMADNVDCLGISCV